MSQLLINHSEDLKRLRDEGYQLEVCDGHLFVHHIPYVNIHKEVKLGVLVSTLNLSGTKTVKPENHVIMFSGEQPCDKNGVIITGIQHSSASKRFSNDIITSLSFSNKPPQGYLNYYEKVKTYATIISSPAKALNENITERPFNPIIENDVNSVFKYYDTNSSRANIEFINEKFINQKIAIIGLGGTGAYILDLIAKTKVNEIHIYDGDVFLNHNAFRSPGAASIEDLEKKPKKVDYYKDVYSKMRNNIFGHSYYLTEDNFKELNSMDYVFISIDNNLIRSSLVSYLNSLEIPFIDVGLGVNSVNDCLIGTVRVTTGTKYKNDHFENRIPASNNPNNEYETNIQIAELNSLNAVLAVLKWKKLSGFYQDLENEHHTTYSINNSHLQNEEVIV